MKTIRQADAVPGAGAALWEDDRDRARPGAGERMGQPVPGRCAPPRRLITTKDVLWAFYLYCGTWLSRISPAAPDLIMRGFEPIFQRLAIRRKNEVLARLARLFGPETPTSALKPIVRSYITNAVRQAGEDLVLCNHGARVRCASFSGREYLDEALAEGKGVLLASLHWFSRRAANRYLAAVGFPVMTVRNRYQKDLRMGRFGWKYMQPRYARFLHEVIRDEVYIQDPDCSLKLLARLRSGGIVDIHLDGAFSRKVVDLPFLDATRGFPAGPFHLVRLSGCAVLPVLILGHARALDIRIGRPMRLDRGLPADDFWREHLPALVRILESYVLEHPDQWELWTRI